MEEDELQWRVRASSNAPVCLSELTHRHPTQCLADPALLSSVAGTRARFLCLDAWASQLALGASTGRCVACTCASSQPLRPAAR